MAELCLSVVLTRPYCSVVYDRYVTTAIGASDQPCSETFAGPFATSEPEALAQTNFMLSRNGTWDLFITLHSYGQLWMAPYGYTTTLPENFDTLVSEYSYSTSVKFVYRKTRTFTDLDKKSSQVVGLRPPLHMANFCFEKHNANPLTIRMLL